MIEGATPWEVWINNHSEIPLLYFTSYDTICELAISSYELDKNSRKHDLKDKVHFFLIWWYANRNKMIKYNVYTRIGLALKIDHSSVMHYCKDGEGKRKKSNNFEENTKCIKDFLES